MSRRLFGTDGVRGVANRDLTPELAFRLGFAAGKTLVDSGSVRRAVIGRDTRRSGPMLGAALTSGLCSAGIDVVTVGVAPTPAIGFAARTQEFSLGVVISASHNPAPDNGIKFLGHDGKKLADETERAIEAIAESNFDPRPIGGEVGSLQSDRAPLAPYVEFLCELVPERLEGLKVALDAAHGAGYELGVQVLSRLGAQVTAIGTDPDGMNINLHCGATIPQTIQQFTVDSRADVGVAFDGDADRAVFSDEKGSLVNGDRTIGIWSAHWRRNGRMPIPIVVGTVMSNGGFEKYLVSEGIELRRAAVGDKYVAREIEATGARVGGEQSGHIIFPDLGPTGDGLATALEFLRVLKREGRPASSFVADYDAWPQLLVNLQIADRNGWEQREGVSEAIQAAESRLAGDGRLSVRASGTQPMLRIMVEAGSESLRDEVAEVLLAELIERLDGKVYSRVDLTHALGD